MIKSNNNVNLTKNAVNRVATATESHWHAWKISLILKFKYRFKCKGRFIKGFEEVIYHDYVKDDIIINSGWDIGFGYDWSADNAETDKFLKQFYQQHLN